MVRWGQVAEREEQVAAGEEGVKLEAWGLAWVTPMWIKVPPPSQ